ncbi:DEAD/DEAH box helicase [Pseudomonas sp.]|uniref:DEAD/DEAH box helicase n=1 Tax=Pseudomonas sp. TaxID=306 RepID=UPI0028AEB018|nr:DEAD/DEAH box helicase [Pseudomonas sp.]
MICSSQAKVRTKPSVTLCNSGLGLLQRAIYDGYDFGLKFSYLEGANKLLLAKGGSYIRNRQHPYAHYWRVPKAHLLNDLEAFFGALLQLAKGKYVQSWSNFSQKLNTAQENIQNTAFIWGMRLRLAPLAEGGTLLSGDYHPGCVAVTQRMKGRYLSHCRSWRIPASAELICSNLILELGLSEDQIELLDVIQEFHSDGSLVPVKDITRISIGGALTLSRPDARTYGEDSESDIYLAAVSPITTTQWEEKKLAEALKPYSLLPHQPAGIRHLLQRSSALLADDMGLGKTRQAVIAASIQAAGRPVLVVVLASLIINWEREIRQVYSDAKISRQAFDEEAQWTIVNYERLSDYVPIADRFAVMIIDEAHRLKEPTAAWTRYGFDIAAKISNRYLLSGTPVLNRESELHTLLRLSGHRIGQLPLKDFCERFTGSPTFRQALRLEINDWMLRRRKDVLPGLMGKKRQIVPVSLSKEQFGEYNDISSSGRPVFARLGLLRQFLERAKVSIVVEWLAELDATDKVILFCEYKETVTALKAHCEAVGLGCVTLVGTDSVTKRQKSIDSFQQNAETQIFIGTTSAAGTGNNLTAANYVFFLGLPWTPGLQDQAEDRAYRNGQRRLVMVKIPLVENTIDQQLWQMLEEKRLISKDLVEPEAIKHSQAALAQGLMA